MHKKMKINVEGWRKAQNSKENFVSPKEMYTNIGNARAKTKHPFDWKRKGSEEKN